MWDPQLSGVASNGLMGHLTAILRHAGECVDFAWFPSSIFQTFFEWFVTQLEKGGCGGDVEHTNGRVSLDDTITLVQLEHLCKHVREYVSLQEDEISKTSKRAHLSSLYFFSHSFKLMESYAGDI